MKTLFKNFIAEVRASKDDDTITALVSTDTVDRMGEALDPKGADLSNFKKNPVVLFGHDYGSPPIGKAVWIKKSAEGVTAKIKFADTEFAQEIKGLFEGGFMNAFSVGFLPNFDTVERDDSDKAGRGKKKARLKFMDWELLEFSAVPVPANPDAIRLAMEKGLSISDSTKKAIEDFEEEGNEPRKDKAAPQAKAVDHTEELLAEIKTLQDKCNSQEKEINNFKYQIHLSEQKPTEKTLSEMSVSEVQNIIKDIANGVIRKAQGKVD